MFRSISILIALSFVITGCDFTFPKVGSVVQDTRDSNTLTDTTHTTSDTSTTSSDTSNSDDTVTIPNDTLLTTDTTNIIGHPPSGIRTCHEDWECQNATVNGTYECTDGVCKAPKIPCSNDFECTDRNICTGIEKCHEGYCALGTRWTCNDSDPWTEEECNPATGCMYWPVHECIRDDDCGDPDLRCSSELGGDCIERDTCILDQDCEDPSACTFDRCVGGRCENIEVVCYDFNPNTLDLCDPLIAGCYFPEMCEEDDDCTDTDITTESTCVGNDCVHTRTYIHLSLFSIEYRGAKLDLDFGGVRWIGTLPYQMYLPFQDLCTTGLLIDVKDEDGACLPLDYQSIDVWSGLEEITPIIVNDGCGGALFVHESLFDCIP